MLLHKKEQHFAYKYPRRDVLECNTLLCKAEDDVLFAKVTDDTLYCHLSKAQQVLKPVGCSESMCSVT